ncbi:hypothetical protein ACL02T_10085 [Pseudonocardia sp. RS010]|uniref:hypothetical protein n=1 Tax=Pseudonocardia sp. RS010 TaxID=3385979 RepID=UPI0039A00016
MASPGAGATSSSAPSGAPNGHHVVHDVHCEPFTGAEAAATVHRDPSSQPLPAVDLDMPGDGSWITTEATTSCAPDARSGSLSPGREVLLAVGVDRN